jgi:hypothetical protein
MSYLHGIDVAICLLAGLSSIAWFEALKALRRNTVESPQSRIESG